MIVDLVSSGQTLRDNRLRPLADGTIMRSQAALIANRAALRAAPEVLALARKLLELIEAHLRATRYVRVRQHAGRLAAGDRGKLFAQTRSGGFRGHRLAGRDAPTATPTGTRSTSSCAARA